jgi:acid phosphatase (class A)
MELNEIVYGNPPLKWVTIWKEEGKEKFNLAKEQGVIDEFLSKYPCPTNDSDTTRKELEQLVSKTKELSEEERGLAEILDEDSFEFWEKLCRELGGNTSANQFQEYVEKFRGILCYLKFKINRPRPFQLASYYKIAVFPLMNTSSTNTASYPSGHTFEYLLILDYLKKIHPEHKSKLAEIYKKIRHTREWLGVHYPSDTVGAEKLFLLLKKNGIV